MQLPYYNGARMSYAIKEKSTQDGQPLYLYEFTSEDGAYRFIDNPLDVELVTRTWLALDINHTEVKVSNEVSKNSLKVTFPTSDGEFQSQFIGWSPDKAFTFTLFRAHVGEADVVTYWKGRVSSVQLAEDEITLNCESIFTSLKRAGIRPRFERNCRHSLYSPRCGVLTEDYKVETSVSSISGLSLTTEDASSYVDGWFTGGFVLFSNGTTRQIVSHVGNTITINRDAKYILESFGSIGYGLGYGLFWGGFYVSLFPGCDRTVEMCKNKFNNLPNQGGFKHIPVGKNPFGGTSLV